MLTSTGSSSRKGRVRCGFLVLTILPIIASCQSDDTTVLPSVSTALQSGAIGGETRSPAYRPRLVDRPTQNERNGSAAAVPVAVVDGQPISRDRVVGLLLRSHGPDILEQLIVLDAAKRLAGERGLSVARADIDRERDLATRAMVDPAGLPTSREPDSAEAEELLEAVLASRNISREEFTIGMERNAYLRKIANSETRIEEDDLREEYRRVHGERVVVRHIQLPTLRELTRVQELLREGEDFSELARQYSSNTASGSDGGLLDPFARNDEAVPELFRQVAFALTPGEVSRSIRVGRWHHLIKLDQKLPPDDTPFEEVRDELRGRLLDRLAEPTMRRLYEQLFKQADVRINDPALREAFLRKYPDKNR